MEQIKKQNIELLSPAGDMECFLAAINFGADAIYIAGEEFGMRKSPLNFTIEEIKKAVEIAHKNNVKVYLTCNTVPINNEIKRMPEFLNKVEEIGIDAIIVSDIGVLTLATKYAKNTEIHISTQAGVTNYITAQALYNLGASRVILAREIPLNNILEIRNKTNKNLQIEVFVHGSMCMSFSGRCLISNYLTSRDANRGDCSQPCRWQYYVMEKTRNGEFFKIEEDSDGSYIFNSKDLCMIEHIPELINSGVTSLKIEGRAKSAYYVSVITNAYRHAIDEYVNNKNDKLPSWIIDETNRISHRKYSKGFYFNEEPGQVLDNGGYIREWGIVAVSMGYENGKIKLSQRNKFFKGDTLNILEPNKIPYDIKIQELYDEYGNPIDSAPHATQIIYIKTEHKVPEGAVIRKKLL